MDRDKSRCIVKIGTPEELHECGQPCEFLTALEASAKGLYSGWHHVDTATRDHNAVPRSWI
jgi:hypothetical protein